MPSHVPFCYLLPPHVYTSLPLLLCMRYPSCIYIMLQRLISLLAFPVLAFC